MTVPDHQIHTPDGSCCAPNGSPADAPRMRKFAHLHQHTQYSLLDGAAKLKDLLKWVKEVTPNDPACAITDHGNMHGAVHFYNYATSMGVKPILGYEAYVAAGNRRDRKPGESGEKGTFHLTLLARDFEGYQNLCRLSSAGYLEGYYYKPRIDRELIAQHSKGVIALSGCLGAEVPQFILQDRLEDARERLLWYQSVFRENYFIEVQDHGLPEDRKVMEVLRSWAREFGIGMAATNDGHYVKKDDALAHETLLAIQTKATMADEKRFKFPCDEFYVKSLEEMQQALPPEVWGEEPFDNTAHIASICNVDLPVGKKRVYQMPALPIPEGRSMAEELRVQTYRGTVRRYARHATSELVRSYARRSLDRAGDAAFLREYYAGVWAPKQQAEPEQYPPQKFEGINFDGEAKRLRQRTEKLDVDAAPIEDVYAALAFAGSVWEELGKATGEKYTRYPALEELEREAKEGFVPDGVDAEQYAHALVILRRAEYELSVINNMGFPDYFLIVADYINWAKDQGISVGPGRGSGAGSLVAYAIRITNLDPLEYELLFERFLNPDRVSMPDFDIDFSDARREEVIQYVRRKYGDDKVAQIATFGTMASKACLKDVARVMGLEYAKVDKVSKLIPIKFGKSYSLEEARESVPDIEQMLAEDAQLEGAYAFAQKLEGLTRHASVHAAGVVIGRTQLTDLVPLMRDTSGEGVVCQFDMKAVEDIGLIKMDFLGLRTLSFLEEAQRILKESRGLNIDFDDIPLDDEASFELLSRGDTKGVFQLEGAGISDASRRLKPRRLADIIALSALYRPGPMENIPTYVRRHHGQEPVTYDEFPNSEKWLEKILRETYGIPVYQEQIMQIASEVAGYSLGGADLLRRAMGKKDAEEMKRQRMLFEEGSKNNGVPKDEANRLFDLLEAFANYGFNKCVVGSTLVTDARTGRRVPVIDIVEGRSGPVSVPSLDEATLEIVPRAVVDAFPSGRVQTYHLRTETGRELTATGNHPFYTVNGWRDLSRVEVGDYVAVPREVPFTPSGQLHHHELVVLGYAISEGNLRHPSGFYVYAKHEEELSDFVRHLEMFGNTIATVDRSKSAASAYAKRLDRTRPSEAVEFLRDLNLLGVGAIHKHLPEVAFTLPAEQAAVLLGRLWTGDGGIQPGTRLVHYATSSRQLARDVQELLLRLGLMSRVHEKQFRYRGELRAGFTVHLLGGEGATRRFAQLIGPHLVGKRQRDLQALLATYRDGEDTRFSLDVLPNAAIPGVEQVVREEAALAGVPYDAFVREAGFRSGRDLLRVKPNGRGLSMRSVRTLAQKVPHPTLERLANSGVYWDRVVSIDDAGVQDVYDLTVEGTHNFIADGLVVHNSHSAAYGVITYQTAWLKANYPVEFMAALLTVERRDSDKVSEYVSDARKMSVVVLPPDINRSGADFRVVGQEILFGLYAIKGLGEGAVQRILEERERGGRYESLANFCQRIDSKTCNRKGLEALVKSGAFDAFGERRQLLDSLEEAVAWAQGAASLLSSGMDALFGAAEVAPEPKLKQGVEPLSELEKLSLEKEALGLYISGHPLEQHEGLREAASCRIADLEAWFGAQNSKPDGQGRNRVKAVLAGMIEAVVKKPTKSGGMMARFNLADESATTELVAFSRSYDRIHEKLVNDTPALVIVEVESEDGGLRAIAEELVPVDALSDVPKVMYVDIDVERAAPGELADFQSYVDEHAGSMPTYFRFLMGDQYVVYQLDKGVGSHDALRIINTTFSWANAYLAYDNTTILARFAPAKPAWMQRQQRTVQA